MLIGEKIRHIRKEKNLKQSELAKMLNVSNKLISKWENNLSEPSISYINIICNLFNVNIDYFSTNSEPQKKLGNDRRVSKLSEKTKKIIIISLIGISCLTLVTAITLLTVFCFIPNANKNHYINLIDQSIVNYIEENNLFNFDYEISVGTNKSKYNISGYNGCDELYGEFTKVNDNNKEFQVVIKDNIIYNFKTLSKSYLNKNVDSLEKLFNLLAYDISDEVGDFPLDTEYVFYVRKFGNIYYVELNKNFANSLIGNTNIRITSKIKGKFATKNNKFSSMNLNFSIKIDDKKYEASCIVRANSDFVKESDIDEKISSLKFGWKIEDCKVLNEEDLIKSLSNESFSTIEFANFSKSQIFNNKIIYVDSDLQNHNTDVKIYEITNKNLSFNKLFENLYFTEVLYLKNNLLYFNTTGSIYCYNLNTDILNKISDVYLFNANIYNNYSKNYLIFNNSSNVYNKLNYLNGDIEIIENIWNYEANNGSKYYQEFNQNIQVIDSPIGTISGFKILTDNNDILVTCDFNYLYIYKNNELLQKFDVTDFSFYNHNAFISNNILFIKNIYIDLNNLSQGFKYLDGINKIFNLEIYDIEFIFDNKIFFVNRLYKFCGYYNLQDFKFNSPTISFVETDFYSKFNLKQSSLYNCITFDNLKVFIIPY